MDGWIERWFVAATAMALVGCRAPEAGDDGDDAAAQGSGDGETETDTDADAETDTDAETETETDGSDPPAACEAMPVADASFSVELTDWPAAESNRFRVEDVACTVATVATVDGSVETTLECDDEGQTRSASVLVAAADSEPAWAVGDPLVLTYDYYRDHELETGTHHALLLRDEGDLVIAATDAGSGADYLGDFSGLDPVTLTEDLEFCGWESASIDEFPYRLEFGLAEASGGDLMQRLGQPVRVDRAAGDIDDRQAGARAERAAQKAAGLAPIIGQPAGLDRVVAARRDPAEGGAGAHGDHVFRPPGQGLDPGHHRLVRPRHHVEAPGSVRPAHDQTLEAEDVERLLAVAQTAQQRQHVVAGRLAQLGMPQHLDPGRVEGRQQVRPLGADQRQGAAAAAARLQPEQPQAPPRAVLHRLIHSRLVPAPGSAA